MKLTSNQCVECRQPIGYCTAEAMQIPMLCPACVGNPETLRDWGHKLDKREKPIREVLATLRSRLNHMDLA